MRTVGWCLLVNLTRDEQLVLLSRRAPAVEGSAAVNTRNIRDGDLGEPDAGVGGAPGVRAAGGG